jgi:hypothetical protein
VRFTTALKTQVFNNRNPDGSFFPALNATAGLHVPELTTEAENFYMYV